MAAYIAAFEQYKTAVPALVRKHGGQYLVRGGTCEVLEGTGRAFDSDPEYQPWKALRQRTAATEAVAVEGDQIGT